MADMDSQNSSEIKKEENTSAFRAKFEIKMRFLDKQTRISKVMEHVLDAKVFADIDFVAFDQDELNYLYKKRPEKIYLCGEIFKISLDVDNIEYIGINNPIVQIDSTKVINFKEKNVTFTNTVFNKEYDILVSDYEKYLQLRARFKAQKEDNKNYSVSNKENREEINKKNIENNNKIASKINQEKPYVINNDIDQDVVNVTNKDFGHDELKMTDNGIGKEVSIAINNVIDNSDAKKDKVINDKKKLKYSKTSYFFDMLNDEESQHSLEFFDKFSNELYDIEYDYSDIIISRQEYILKNNIRACALDKFLI